MIDVVYYVFCDVIVVLLCDVYDVYDVDEVEIGGCVLVFVCELCVFVCVIFECDVVVSFGGSVVNVFKGIV